jgi:hypothetical protein
MQINIFVLFLLFVAQVAFADSSAFAKRPFLISNDSRDLVVESSATTLLTENTVQTVRRLPSLGFGFFAGSTQLKKQTVKMGDSLTVYETDRAPALGIDLKKDYYAQSFGMGFQLEYQNYRNELGALHILPATAYFFGRTRGYTKVGIKAVGEIGYSSAYVRQLGTLSRTGGLGANAAFAQGGFEIPVGAHNSWNLGIFYSERFMPEGDLDLAGGTFKLQGAVTL